MPQHTRKWELATTLANHFGDELPPAAAEYVYAGQKSISWVRLIPEDIELDLSEAAATYPMKGAELSPGEVKAALMQESGFEDPYAMDGQPAKILEGEPQLILAREREDGILLLFAMAQRKGQAIHNFQAAPVIEDDFFPVIFRPQLGLFEIRASKSHVRKLSRSWLRRFASAVGCQPVPVGITYSDLRKLHTVLNGKLDVYTGADATGTSIYETHRLTRAEDVCDDLLDEKQFSEDTKLLQPVNGDLVFEYSSEFDEVRVHVSCANGSVWVRTAVPEEVIIHVRRAVEKIKGL